MPEIGLQHVTSAAYHSKGNGLAERTISTMKRCMERLADGGLTKWTEYLNLAVIDYCTLPHKATGFSPFRLLYEQEAHTPAKVGKYKYANIRSYNQAATEHTTIMREIFETALRHARLFANRRAAR